MAPHSHTPSHSHCVTSYTHTYSYTSLQSIEETEGASEGWNVLGEEIEQWKGRWRKERILRQVISSLLVFSLNHLKDLSGKCLFSDDSEVPTLNSFLPQFMATLQKSVTSLPWKMFA